MHIKGWTQTEKNDEKGSGQEEKARPISENEKRDLFSLWVFDSDVQDVLIFLVFTKDEHDLLSF